MTNATPAKRRGTIRSAWSTAAGIAGRIVLGAVLLLLTAVLVVSLWTNYYIQSNRGMLPAEVVDRVEYPDQGWGAGLEAAGRQTYYYTAQGAGLKDLRYRWLLNLEMPLSTTRLADPSILSRYGFVVDPKTDENPDHLPVGFTKYFDRALNEDLVDITCAACHTGQLHITRNGRTTAIRVDGGSAVHAITNTSIGHFVPTLVSSMLATAVNPIKFRRFANHVLGEGTGGRLKLHSDLREVIGKFVVSGYYEKTLGLSPTEEGYGRTDALARISNTVFGDNLDRANYRIGNGPVNYPPVWNIWKFDWVQYNASVSQPMARNVGESMGTGAKYALVNRYGSPLPKDEQFRSSAIIENLHTIELTLRTLQPPAWPETLLGPIDPAKAERGKALFTEHCQSCHGPHNAPAAIKHLNSPLKTATDPEWLVKTLCIADIGTDPNTAANFANTNAEMDITRTGLTAEDLRTIARPTLEKYKARRAMTLSARIAALSAQPPTPATATELADRRTELQGLDAEMQKQLDKIDPARLPIGIALSYLGGLIKEKAYADLHYTEEQQADRDGFGVLDRPQIVAGYKPRPLAGLWASPPFLHNGSVPTLYDLLSPVAERPRTFRVGSREFDPVKVGLAAVDAPYWILDTEKDGNHNTGHEFSARWKAGDPPANGSIGPLLSHDDRMAIIEHLKVRNDDLDGDPTPHIPMSEVCETPPSGPKPRTLWQRWTGASQ